MYLPKPSDSEAAELARQLEQHPGYKVIVVDADLVITGSFNFTNSAQTRNAENLLVLKSAGLADSYKANWQTHWNHSR